MIAPDIARRSKTNPGQTFELDKLTGFMIDRELYDTHQETLKLALFRLYLEGLGVAVDKRSLSVVDRSETYTFGDLLASNYITRITSELETSLAGEQLQCNNLAIASVRQYVRGFF